MKKIVILGSTGSIGVQALEVCRALGDICVTGLSAAENTDLLYNQILEWRPEAVSVKNKEKAYVLEKKLRSEQIKTTVLGGEASASALFDSGPGLLLNALVGSAGLKPTYDAITRGINILLANKETLVAGGELIMRKAHEARVNILPIDSEHSAILQCIEGNRQAEIERILLTASGGPFRGYSAAQLSCVTRHDALKHPNWRMGEKITVDSATLMNKGLELIEAKWLFDIDADKIEVLVHPQSIIHSMVEFADGAVMAQLGEPDMRIPIQYALTWPLRAKNNFPRVSFIGKSLTFEQPDRRNFPCLDIAAGALKEGGVLPAVMNAANESAVRRFLRGEISFTCIARIIESVINEYTVNNRVSREKPYTLADVLYADEWARSRAAELVF